MAVSAKFVPVQKDREGRGSQGSIGRGYGTGSQATNTSSKNIFSSFLSSFENFNNYKETHKTKFPLNEYLEGTKTGEILNGLMGVTNDDPVNAWGNNQNRGQSTLVEDLKNIGVDISSSPSIYDTSSAKPIVYSEWSPASKLFGMNQDTAFSEHMANTAHQREVADLKAAGLNPVLGISGSGASSVSGNSAVGSSSAEKASEFPWIDVLGATAGLVTTVVTKKPSLGYMVANVFKAFDK